MMGVAGLAGDPAYPAQGADRCRQYRSEDRAPRYARALNKLGWHWWPSERPWLRPSMKVARKCINLGQCTLGCAQGAKASTDITYWPHALRAA